MHIINVARFPKIETGTPSVLNFKLGGWEIPYIYDLGLGLGLGLGQGFLMTLIWHFDSVALQLPIFFKAIRNSD